jgi:dipeptidyl aminopeptidase/acylaminoacyl peptidase
VADTLPCGSWPSPITAEVVVAASVSLGGPAFAAGSLWWSELRPAEAGRVQVVRRPVDGRGRPTGPAVDVLPEGCSARTRVHEYGGGAWWLHDATLFFCNWTDQRIWRLRTAEQGAAAVPVTPEPAARHGLRYADGRLTPDGRWIVCVRESHEVPGAPEAVNELVAVPTHGAVEPVVLASGADFYSHPRPSPDGRRLCWLQWDHPRMPWDGSELWVADLDAGAGGELVGSRARRVLGGPQESLAQPSWDDDGVLHVVSDRTGWWNLYRFAGPAGVDGEPELRGAVDGELALPQWVFGQSRYAFGPDGTVVCTVVRDGVDHLAVIDRDGALHWLESPYTSLEGLCHDGGVLGFVGASFTVEPQVVTVPCPSPGGPLAPPTAVRPARELGIDPAWFSVPEPFSFPTTDGATAHALYYPPTNPSAMAPPGERPPLVVLSHGGPTGAARAQLNLALQYWTSRGLAVVDVNYRGSTGYGRAYRQALAGVWGIADVDDCVAAADALVVSGRADTERLIIRGGSAGGYTTLCALTFRDAFRAGASLYGVADLETLARDTHKFESRYLDTLVAPYPEGRDTYLARSPIRHTDRLSCPTILLQGLEDEVVPPAQAEMMAEALRRRGVPFAYLAFPGEQHGFRQAANIMRALEAELYFYARILGFALADDIEPVEIEQP